MFSALAAMGLPSFMTLFLTQVMVQFMHVHDKHREPKHMLRDVLQSFN